MKKLTIFLFILFPLIGTSQLNTNHVIHTGRSRLYFGNYTGAIESFNMVIRIKPYLPEPYFYRGAAKLNLEDYQGAKSDLNKAIEIKPFYPEAIMYRGIVNYNMKAYELAMQDYSTAMELDGENADIFNNRGICKAAMRDFEGAIADYTKSIELKPKNFNAYLNRSIAYQIQKDWDNAISDCNQLIRIKTNSPMGYISRGLIKIEKENFAGALRDFDMAIYLDPKNAFAYQNRGLVKQQLESYEAAIMDYTSALQIDNQMASAYFNRGIAKEMTGENGYQKDYNLASTIDPRYEKRPWQTPQERAQAQQKQAQQQMNAWKQGNSKDDTEQANSDSIQTGKKEMGINLEELRKRKMKANLVVEDNRNIPGKEDEESIKLQNQNINIQLLPLFEVATINKNSANNETVGYFNMIIETLNSGNNYQPYLTLINQPRENVEAKATYENQILVFDERIKQNDEFSNNYLYRGIFKALISDFQSAIIDFDSAIKYNERNLLAYFMRANSRARMIEAIEALSSPNNTHLTQSKLQNDYSKNKKELNEINESLEEIFTDYTVVLYMNPDFIFGYFNRGNIYCQNERYFDALEEYSKALKIEPEFAEAYYNRGLVKILLNDTKGGSNDLSKAGELGIKESYNVIKRYCNK